MVTPFGRLSGEAYSGAFRSFRLTHHQEAMRLTDSVLPQLARPCVKAIAQRIRSARARDIAALQRKPPNGR
jgi:uncharacterized protein (DUF305 family)